MLAISQQLLAAKSALAAVAVTPELAQAGLLETTHYLNWGTGVTSGAVTIETADDPAYTGTWAPVIVVPFAGTAPKQDYIRVQGAYKCFRHRISTVLANGTVTSSIQGSMA
jgi:hypothetical protein